MLIYIRHGNDHDDDSEYSHDRHLTDQAKQKASKVARRLIKKHGHPVAIYVSPFQRARETLEAMSDRFKGPVALRQDPRVASHLGKKQHRDPDVSPETARVVTIVESKDDFHRRIYEHVEDMRYADLHRSRAVIWCVTHKAVVKAVGAHFGVDVPKRIGFLDYIVVS